MADPVLSVDVGLVLQEQAGGGDGGDAGGQVQGCVPVDVQEVGIGLVPQQRSHAAVLLALHRLRGDAHGR